MDIKYVKLSYYLIVNTGNIYFPYQLPLGS